MEATRQASEFTTPSEREAVLTRVFDASREQVFKTVLDPDLIHEWWGPHRFSVRVDQMDVRPGGEWRFVLRDAVSRVFTFHGVFKEIVPPDRVSYTFEFEGLSGHAVLETAEFDDLGGGKTRVRFVSLFESQGDRDAAMRWGVREGALETIDRFAKVLTRCAARPGGHGETPSRGERMRGEGTDGDSRPA
jgi:uncharacterized protein YndB with AHSA1/START domain